MRLLNAMRRHKPDVVWFNLVFSSFGTPDNPFAAFVGLSAPALTRAAGFYTHITLHHIVEHVDFSTAGVRREKLYRFGTDVATRALLRAHSVSVLLSAYRRTLLRKYAAEEYSLRNPRNIRRASPGRRIFPFAAIPNIAFSPSAIGALTSGLSF